MWVCFHDRQAPPIQLLYDVNRRAKRVGTGTKECVGWDRDLGIWGSRASGFEGLALGDLVFGVLGMLIRNTVYCHNKESML